MPKIIIKLKRWKASDVVTVKLFVAIIRACVSCCRLVLWIPLASLEPSSTVAHTFVVIHDRWLMLCVSRGHDEVVAVFMWGESFVMLVLGFIIIIASSGLCFGWKEIPRYS